jgi:spermidine/putrescine transport system permease protein
MTTAAVTIRAPREHPLRRVLAFVRRNLLTAYAALALAYLFLPIAVVILFSFNDPAGRFNFTWEGFTLKNWADPFGVPGIQDAIVVSIEIAALSCIFATALGALIALALVRYQFRGRGVVNTLIFLPMTTPEIVMGSSLLTLFIAYSSVIDLGFWTILIAHIMFCVSYVVVTVKARLTGFDLRLEEAAMDLYANSWRTFRRVTLPLIMPGVAAAAALCFALSIDDFVVTQFNSGNEVTFPLFIYGASRNGVPVQVNVIGSAIFLIAVGGMFLNLAYQNRKAKREAMVERRMVAQAQSAEAHLV